jgi:hypothetical protein
MQRSSRTLPAAVPQLVHSGTNPLSSSATFFGIRKRAFSRPQITVMLQISIVATLPSNFARFDR